MTSLAKQSKRSHTSGRPGGLVASCVALGLGLAIPGAVESAPAVSAKKAPAAEFPAATLIIEFNASAEDVGVQFFLDADEWQTVRILDPSGKEVFQSTARGRLLDQGGGTELFVESVEPELIELPLDEFFEIFPAGTYTFLGRTPDGERLASTVEFTHVIPAGPEVVLPVGSTEECTENVPIPAVIAWNDVTATIDGSPLDGRSLRSDRRERREQLRCPHGARGRHADHGAERVLGARHRIHLRGPRHRGGRQPDNHGGVLRDGGVRRRGTREPHLDRQSRCAAVSFVQRFDR